MGQWTDRRRDILGPPPLLDLPRFRGSIRGGVEDFQVVEIPAYPTDGGEGHLFLELTKRGWNTDAALQEVARHLGIPRGELGVAGMKDRHALTRQWISVPMACQERLATFSHPEIQLGHAQAHSHKLRRGHLRGNAFRLVLRQLDRPATEALDMARQALDELVKTGGMGHVFGPQRFGHGGYNVETGLRLLERPARIRPGDLALSALQSALFNLLWLWRQERGILDLVLEGDILRKAETGGLFYSADPTVDQQRFDAGELRLTGPIFGADRLVPPEGSAAALLEEEALAAFGTTREQWKKLGKKAPGTRRTLRTQPTDLALTVEDNALVLSFTLEAGAFATRLLDELMDWTDASRSGGGEGGA
jgi:tRNA pseudouridine13 synthase